MDNASAKQTVVLYPGGGAGHVGPMMQLANVFLHHGYDVTMVLLEPPIKSTTASSASFVESLTASNPSITFHLLPPVAPPDFASSGKHPFLLMLEALGQYDDKLESFLRSITPRERLHSLVIDMFCVHAIDVAAKVGVPVYTFFAASAGSLAVLRQTAPMLAGRQTGLKELGDTPIQFLGVPPMPASHILKEMLEDPEDELCKAMAEIWKRDTDTRGVLINTFDSLESRALQAFADPRCVPGEVLPPVYGIGPLVGKGGSGTATDGEEAPRHECLAWLDAQPERSVVFLCWGSRGLLSGEQLKEIAAGLENSGQRFLWVVRTPPVSDDPKRFWEPRPEPDLDVLLPEGFLERTRDRGLVLKSWAPQVEVLNSPAIGAFVTHCGWNSTLEAISAGVPMLCWPNDAEQKINKVLMTEAMGIGLELQGYNTGFIKAEEIETKVRLVLESEKGVEIRTRTAELKKEAHQALEDGGSSQATFLRFLSDVKSISE